MFKDFLSTFSFLTVIPLFRSLKLEFFPQRMRPYFPLVGLIIGILAGVLDYFLGYFFSNPVRSWLDVVALIWITGGLHLDGLGDSADGLLSHRSIERTLEIMKDSRVGVMGVLAIISVLGIKWGGISEIGTHRFIAISIIPAYSRTSMVVAMKFLDYCRSSGTAKGFFIEPVKWRDFLPFCIIIGFSCFLSIGAIVINFSFLVITSVMIKFYKHKLGCITGDTLGAMCEIVESFMFLCIGAVL